MYSRLSASNRSLSLCTSISLKHNVAKMNKALSRAQPYIQLEKVMKASSNPSARLSKDETKSKFACEASDHAPHRHKGQPPYKKQALSIMSSSPIQSYRSAKCFTPLRLPIMRFSTSSKINHGSDAQSRSSPIHHYLGQSSIARSTNVRGHQTIHC